MRTGPKILQEIGTLCEEMNSIFQARHNGTRKALPGWEWTKALTSSDLYLLGSEIQSILGDGIPVDDQQEADRILTRVKEKLIEWRALSNITRAFHKEL